MRYFSTRNKKLDFSFKEAFLKGLAPDGGLFIPDKFKEYSPQEIEGLKKLNYVDLAVEIISNFCDPDIQKDKLKILVKKSYKNFQVKDVVSLKKFGELLEEGWIIKKSLATQISNKFINEIYDLGKKNGAYGGKLSGAGGGGFLSFIVQKKFKNKLIYSILKKKLKYFPVNIDSTGSIILTKS